MPLTHGYGVVIGTRHSYYRDPVNDYGQYFHGNLRVATPAGPYHCAIDVDSKSVPHGIRWKLVELDEARLKGLHALADGWHPLAPAPASGALDYIRNPDLRPRRLGCLLGPLLDKVRFVVAPSSELPWSGGTSLDALAVLEPLIAQSVRIFVLGEPFHDGTRGVHNIHQNQGDPIGSPWSRENGIWQDGATVVRRADGTYAVFCTRFSTQSDATDDSGRPLP